jgi:hypothetical protein
MLIFLVPGGGYQFYALVFVYRFAACMASTHPTCMWVLEHVAFRVQQTQTGGARVLKPDVQVRVCCEGRVWRGGRSSSMYLFWLQGGRRSCSMCWYPCTDLLHARPLHS